MKYTQEQVREALMRLSMCARKECEICKYKDRPKVELPSDDCKERSTKNMNILADVCLRADHILANGVILPIVKVGQTVYVPSGDEESDWIDEYKVKYFYCSSKGINRYYIECGTMGKNFRPKDIGKTVFLTREEAEKAKDYFERRAK